MDNEKFEALIKQVKEAFVAENAAGIDLVIGGHLLDEPNGDWLLVIHNQEVFVIPQDETTRQYQPDAELSARYADAMALYRGEMEPIGALISGKVKINGNMSKVMQLGKLFRRPE